MVLERDYFIVNELLRKMKIIVLGSILIKDIVNTAFLRTQYAYEKKNGPIKKIYKKQ
jgi:hypothetical protein